MKRNVLMIILFIAGIMQLHGQTIIVDNPAAGATVCRGQTFRITWTSRGAVGANVRLFLMRGATAFQRIVLDTANDGAFDWPVPATLEPGSYTVNVRSLTNTTAGESAAFTISNCTTPPPPPPPPPPPAHVFPMTLTSPAQGDLVCAGRGYSIRWNRGSNTDPQVRIYLMTSGASVVPSFNVVVPNTGTYNWTIPEAIQNGPHRLVIEPPVIDPMAPIWLADGPVFEISHCYAVRPIISYTGPERIEVCGDMATIQWRSSGDPIRNVKILFASSYCLIASTPNTGSVRLRLPAPLANAVRERGSFVGSIKIESTVDHQIDNGGDQIIFTRCLPSHGDLNQDGDVILNPLIDQLYLSANLGSDAKGGYWADFDLRKIKDALGDPSQPLGMTLFHAGGKVAELGHIGGGKTPPDQVRASLEPEVYKMFFENLHDFAIILKTLEGKQVAKIKTEVLVQ